MATSTDQHKAVVQSYINEANSENKEQLRKLLESAAVEDRMQILAFPNDGWNILHEAALVNDVETVKYLMKNFDDHQVYKALKKQNISGGTALHIATYRGHDELLKFFFDGLSQQHQLQLLKSRNYRGSTLLHEAAKENKASTFLLILSVAPQDEHQSLLELKNKRKQSARDLAPQELLKLLNFKNTEVLSEKTREIAKQEKFIHELSNTCTQLVEQMQKKDTEILEMVERLKNLERALAIQEETANTQEVMLDKMNRRQEDTERLTVYLEKYITTPFATDATGDQENEDCDSS